MLPRATINPVHRRMCLACGDDHQALQRRGTGAVFSCPTCGCDLYARPPRSYAEMEGLKPTGALHLCWRRVRIALRAALASAPALARLAFGIRVDAPPRRAILARAASKRASARSAGAPGTFGVPRASWAHLFEPHDRT